MKRRTRWVSSAKNAVQDRLVKEINYWTHRYEQLKLDVEEGRQPRKQPENAKRFTKIVKFYYFDD